MDPYFQNLKHSYSNNSPKGKDTSENVSGRMLLNLQRPAHWHSRVQSFLAHSA